MVTVHRLVFGTMKKIKVKWDPVLSPTDRDHQYGGQTHEWVITAQGCMGRAKGSRVSWMKDKCVIQGNIGGRGREVHVQCDSNVKLEIYNWS